MNARVKKMWVEALRSGEYKQGEHTLKNDKGEFCCLGVLCDLYAKEKKLKNPWREVPYRSSHSFSTSINRGVPPIYVASWAGLYEENPSIQETDGHIHALSTYNDLRNKNFEEIALLIEKNL